MAKVLLALCLPLHFSSLYWPAYSKCQEVAGDFQILHVRSKETMLAERWQGFTFLRFSHGNKTCPKMSQLARHA